MIRNTRQESVVCSAGISGCASRDSSRSSSVSCPGFFANSLTGMGGCGGGVVGP